MDNHKPLKGTIQDFARAIDQLPKTTVHIKHTVNDGKTITDSREQSYNTWTSFVTALSSEQLTATILQKRENGFLNYS